MAVTILRSSSDDKAEWTETPAGVAWSLLNEAVTEVDTPDTTNNYADTTVNNLFCRQHVDDFTIPDGEEITLVEAWWYLRAATGQAVHCALTGLTATTIVTSTSFAWATTSTTATISQAVVNAIKIQALTVGTASPGSSRLAAQFVRVTTEPFKPVTPGMFDPQLIEEAWF